MVKKIILMALVGLIMMTGMGTCETLSWESYQTGTRLAREQKKNIFLHFRTDWCRYCAQMEQATFADSSVVRFLNDYFVSIKVDGDTEKSIVKKYKVTGYPGNLFLDNRKKEIYRLPGFVDAMAFLFFLEYVQSDAHKTMDPMQYYKSR